MFGRQAPSRAMTLVEMLLVYVVSALVLWLAVGLSNYVQREAKYRQAMDMVLTLREALLTFSEETGQFPTGNVNDAITAMLTEETSRRLLNAWPGRARIERKSTLLDPWGQPFRYLTAQSSRGEHRERVLADGGLPIFESAGADGIFGDRQAGESEDNVASDTALMIMIEE